MTGKGWVRHFFLVLMMSVIGIEVMYQFYAYSRHEVDFIVKDKLEHLKGEVFEAVILGDSLAQNSFSALILHDKIVDLSSNDAISIAGNYFILRKYLKQNKKPENVYLFATANIFYNNLDSIHTYSYFETVFTDEDQIKEIKELRPNLFESKVSIDRFLEARRKAFLVASHYTPPVRIKGETVSEADLFKKGPFSNKAIEERIEFLVSSKDLVYNIPKVYLNKIIELCREENIDFTLVIEPQESRVNEVFKQSKIYQFLIDSNVHLVNINDHYTFANYFFRHDGVHIRGKVNQYYQNLIDKHILDIY